MRTVYYCSHMYLVVLGNINVLGTDNLHTVGLLHLPNGDKTGVVRSSRCAGQCAWGGRTPTCNSVHSIHRLEMLDMDCALIGINSLNYISFWGRNSEQNARFHYWKFSLSTKHRNAVNIFKILSLFWVERWPNSLQLTDWHTNKLLNLHLCICMDWVTTLLSLCMFHSP